MTRFPATLMTLSECHKLLSISMTRATRLSVDVPLLIKGRIDLAMTRRGAAGSKKSGEQPISPALLI